MDAKSILFDKFLHKKLKFLLTLLILGFLPLIQLTLNFLKCFIAEFIASAIIFYMLESAIYNMVQKNNCYYLKLKVKFIF